MYHSRNFQILVPIPGKEKRYSRNDIEIEEVVGGLSFHPQDMDIENRIEESWKRLLNNAEEQVKEGKRKGMPFSGPLYSLEGFENNYSRMKLYLGGTNFRDSIGTNWEAGRDSEYMDLLKERGLNRKGNEYGYFADALAMCTAVKTHNEKGEVVYLIGMRSYELDEYPLCIHVPGTVGNRKPFQDKPFDPFESIYYEALSKELFLEERDILNISCLGLVRNGYSLKPELVFETEVGQPFEKIKQERMRLAPQRSEHFTTFSVEQERLAEFLNITQKPEDSEFFNKTDLSDPDKSRILEPYSKRGRLVENTGNWWVPTGEACLTLVCINEGVNIDEFPYIEVD